MTSLPAAEQSSRRRLGGLLTDEQVHVAVAAVLIGITFVLTDHDRDFVSFATSSNDGATDSPELVTTLARIGLLMGMIGLVAVRRDRVELPRTRVLVPIGVFAGYLALSALWSPDFAFTVRKLIVLSVVVATAACTTLVFDLRRIVDIILVVFASYLVLGVIYEIATGSVKFLRVYRFTGTTGPNQNGVFAAILATICACRLLIAAKSRRATALYWVLLILAAGITLVTLSRTAMAAFFASIVGVGLAIVLSRRASTMQRLAIVGTLAVTGIAILRLSRRRVGLITFDQRRDIWEPLLDAIGERPIAGYGYLGYWVEGGRNSVRNPHSMYIDLLLDGGVIAVVLFLGAVAAPLLILFQRVRHRPSANEVIALAILVFAVVHGLTEAYFSRPTIGLFFLVCLVLRADLDPDQSATIPAESANEPMSDLSS